MTVEVRIARHTGRVDDVAAFDRDGLGLPVARGSVAAPANRAGHGVTFEDPDGFLPGGPRARARGAGRRRLSRPQHRSDTAALGRLDPGVRCVKRQPLVDQDGAGAMRYDPPRAGHKAWVSVLREDPALAEGVPAVELPAARRAAVAKMWWLEKGPWQPDQIGPGEHGSLGVLVLGGLLLRRVTVHGSPCAELLGPGDVLRPWSVRLEQAASIPVHATFRVLAESRVANLDRDFAVRVARWPEITDGLIERVTDRMRRLSYNLAAQRSRRVDERLWLMLWQLADRWGTVGPYGVELAVPGLSHSVLGSLIAAHRPSVTTAMGRLAARGLIRRFPNGSVLLCGDPSSGAFDQGDDRAAASIEPLRPPEISVEARVTRTCAERLPQQGS